MRILGWMANFTMSESQDSDDCVQEPSDKDLRQMVDGLARFLPIFADPAFKFAEWRGEAGVIDNVLHMPHLVHSADAHAFTQAAYQLGWVLMGFDWSSWSATSEARALREDPDRLAETTPAALARLLTALIRQDRFAEGTLNEAYEQGILTNVLQRMAELSLE